MMRTGHLRSRAIILATLLWWGGALPAWGDPGDLDPSFGRRGKVTTHFTPRDDLARGIAIQDDGRIVAAGTARHERFALSRYRRNGRLDPSFGGNGKVTTRFLGGVTAAHAVAIQPDGMIVAAGSTDSENAFAVARYLSDGTLDDSFDVDGKVTTPLEGGHAFARDVAIQADGKILVGGAGGFSRFALIRYEADGDLDASFGIDGVVLTDLPGRGDTAFATAIQPDGKILAAGRVAGARGRFALLRYMPDGNLDLTFGGDGMVFTNFSPRDDAARDVALQSNGRIVVAGFAGGRGRHGRFALARYMPHGQLDASFGNGGKVVTKLTRGRDLALGLAIQADRRIVVAGHAGGTRASAADHRFALVRYRPRGALDLSFGRNGKSIVNFTAGDDWAQDVAIQGDNKIVAAGRSAHGGGSFALLRLAAG